VKSDLEPFFFCFFPLVDVDEEEDEEEEEEENSGSKS
jgi:hypothetical protein